jgi:hypothetical protein
MVVPKKKTSLYGCYMSTSSYITHELEKYLSLKWDIIIIIYNSKMENL